MNSNKEKLNKIIDWKNAKPATDQAWAADVKQESLDVKFDKQLDQIKGNLQKKLPKVAIDLKWITKYPDHKRKEIEEEIDIFVKDFGSFNLEGKTKEQFIEDELLSQTDYYKWKNEKVKQSIERVEKEQDLRKRKIVSRVPIGTTYYIDADNGLDSNDGLTTGAAWKTLDKFTENARSAGDIAILRRGTTARYDNSSDLNFTSDGTLDNPIVIEADFDDVFSDDVALTNTYTPVFGSKVITASATESQLVAGDWIVLGSDGKKEFAYEAKTVSGTTITLYLPYKGDESGAGIAGVKMLAAPIWNLVTSELQWNFDGDHYWKVQGLHVRGKDGNGEIEIDSAGGHIFKDCILEGNGTNYTAWRVTDDAALIKVFKCRTLSHTSQFRTTAGGGAFVRLEAKDCLFDGGTATNGRGFDMDVWNSIIVEECESKNNAGGDIDFLFTNNEPQSASEIHGRNWILSSTGQVKFHHSSPALVHLEDFNGVVGDSRQLTGLSEAEGTPTFQSETGTVRSGGNAISIKVNPSTKLSTKWEMSRLRLFEIPFYATTDSKTYKVYFNLPAAGFTAAPLATELWIELEAWGHASNNHRKVTKSTGVLAIDGTWVSLTITVAPLQLGVAYLKCYYAKTKESGKDNIFFIDPLPEIT